MKSDPQNLGGGGGESEPDAPTSRGTQPSSEGNQHSEGDLPPAPPAPPVDPAPPLPAAVPVDDSPESNSLDIAIRIDHLRKVYEAEKKGTPIVAVRDLSLEIPKGEVFGLIGPNGAGKSSLMKIVATLVPPSFGRVEVCGFDTWSQREEVCRRLGFMPELFYLYEELTVEEYLEFFAGMYCVPRAERKQIIDDVIELTDLGVRRESLSGSLSKGMRQRLLLAKTMIHDPEVLILDEPTSGMDPQARIEFRNVVKVLARMGKTIIISSHILPDLSSFCTSFGIMERGSMRISGTFDEVSRELKMVDRVQVDFLGPPKPVVDLVEGWEEAESPKLRGSTMDFGFDGSEEELAKVLRRFHDAGIPVTRFVRQKTGLEEIFLEVGADQVQ